MNIKSLLLGSAAAMVAVSGAQAADAVIVEPEPVEYVRICDAYGTGFFYIPGTETCIRFSGYIRSSYEKDDVEITGIVGAAAPLLVTYEADYAFWGHRARLNIDTRNETDWGTLRAQMRLEAGDIDSDAAPGGQFDMDRALISLAGFRAGFTDNYWTTNHGYAGVNLTGINGAFGPASDDGWYGFQDASIFDYTFAADGFAVTIGVEDNRNGGDNSGGANVGSDVAFYAGFNYQGDGFGVAFTALHDGDGVADSGLQQDRGGWAWKVSADLDLSGFIPGGSLHGMYMTDGEYNTTYVTCGGCFVDPESIWQVSFQMDLTEELQFVTQYSHVSGDTGEGSGYNAGIGLNWFPAAAPGFSLRGSYKFGEVSDSLVDFGLPIIGGQDVEWHGFFVGVRRDF